MTTFQAQLREEKALQATEAWLGSMSDMLALTNDDLEPEVAARTDVRPWVRNVAERLKTTLFAPVSMRLSETDFTPYRGGYALGLIRWAAENFQSGISKMGELEKLPEMRKIRVRLSPAGKKRLGKLVSNFFVTSGLAELYRYHNSKYIPHSFKKFETRIEKMVGNASSDYHQGMADGLKGIGRDAPGDRSNDATDVYILLMTFSRLVDRFGSVSVLHRWLKLVLGETRVGDRKRIEKICERIDLKFRERGRPRKNPTLALPA